MRPRSIVECQRNHHRAVCRFIVNSIFIKIITLASDRRPSRGNISGSVKMIGLPVDVGKPVLIIGIAADCIPPAGIIILPPRRLVRHLCRLRQLRNPRRSGTIFCLCRLNLHHRPFGLCQPAFFFQERRSNLPSDRDHSQCRNDTDCNPGTILYQLLSFQPISSGF